MPSASTAASEDFALLIIIALFEDAFSVFVTINVPKELIFAEL